MSKNIFIQPKSSQHTPSIINTNEENKSVKSKTTPASKKIANPNQGKTLIKLNKIACKDEETLIEKKLKPYY